MIKHALKEGLSTGVRTKISGETKGLVDRQVGLDDEHWGSGGLSLLENVSSPSVQNSVDTSNCVLGALDFNLINRFHHPGLSGQQGSVEYTPSCGNNLTTSSMDGISVKGNVINVKPDCP